ncbi:MAG: hypothetical protein R3320_05260 [Nitriliruptorales bacterium]|nr:hypothetical protein [Nitriliruptorales bacterium]
MNDSGTTWFGEVLDVLEHRRRLVVATALGVSVVGLLAAYFLPDIVPPNPLVGAAVGLAAALLATAAALGVDSVDLTVRGGRHVRAAGAEVVGVLAGRPDPDATAALAERVVQTRDGPIRLAFAPVSRAITSVPRWTDALAVELSRRDQRVVVLDLASGPDLSGHPGVLEVVRDGLRLGEAVRFDPELLLARLGPGADDEAALAAWPRLAGNIPADVDVLLVALPSVTQPGVIAAIGAADESWLFASVDRTARVDLIAGLDAADRTGTPTEVVLLDPSREHPAPTTVGVADPSDVPVDAESTHGRDVTEHPHGEAETADPEGVAAEERPEPWQEPGYPGEPTSTPAADLHREEAEEEAEDEADEFDDEVAGGALAELSSLAATGVADQMPTEQPAEPDPESAEQPEATEAPLEDPSQDEPEQLAEDQPEDLSPEEPEEVTAEEAPAAGEAVAAEQPQLEDEDVSAEEPQPDPAAPTGDEPHGDATDEIPRIVFDGPVDEPERWTPPDEGVTGRYQAPLAGPERDEDPVRVAAALQTLAQEVWSRDEENG